nr:DUF1385 domain-containing protein [Desulfobacterales bacterium]
MIKFSDRRHNHPVSRLLILPGLSVQETTRQEPSDEQLGIALSALNSDLKVRKEVIGDTT